MPYLCHFLYIYFKETEGFHNYADGIYLLQARNRNTKERYEACSKLKIKTPERRH